MIHAAGGTTSTLYKAVGRPGLDMTLFLATTCGLLFPGMIIGASYWGLVGVAVAIAATKTVSVVIRQVLLNRLVGSTSGAVLHNILVLLVCQAPVVIAWFLAEHVAQGDWMADVFLMILGLAVYGVIELPRALPQVWRRVKTHAERKV
jgi:teichuronic acid exporter